MDLNDGDALAAPGTAASHNIPGSTSSGASSASSSTGVPSGFTQSSGLQQQQQQQQVNPYGSGLQQQQQTNPFGSYGASSQLPGNQSAAQQAFQQGQQGIPAMQAGNISAGMQLMQQGQQGQQAQQSQQTQPVMQQGNMTSGQYPGGYPQQYYGMYPGQVYPNAYPQAQPQGSFFLPNSAPSGVSPSPGGVGGILAPSPGITPSPAASPSIAPSPSLITNPQASFQQGLFALTGMPTPTPVTAASRTGSMNSMHQLTQSPMAPATLDRVSSQKSMAGQMSPMAPNALQPTQSSSLLPISQAQGASLPVAHDDWAGAEFTSASSSDDSFGGFSTFTR